MSETQHSPSLREALAASYDAQVGTDAGAPAADTSTPAPATTDTQSAPASAPTQAATEPSGSDRPRDASGRFAPASGQPATSTAAPASDAPDGYDPAVWAMLSPEAREKTVAWAKSTSSKYEPYAGLDRVLTQQRRDALAMQYGGVDKAMEQLFALSDFAARDPANFVRQFSAQRGVNLAQLMEQAQGGGQQPPQQQQYTPQQAIQAMVQQEIDRRDVDRLYTEFAGQADLEHRNDPQVRTTMAALLAANQAKDYRQAYQMAVRAHPDLGPKWAQAQAAAAAKDQQAQAAEAATAGQKAAEAKAQAAASIVGAPGTARPAADASRNQSVRSTLESAFERAGSARA